MSFSLLFSRKSGGLVVFAVVLICLCYLMYHRSTKAGEVEKRASFTRAERSFSSLGLPHSLLYHPIAEDSLWLEALTDYVASRKDRKCNGSDFVTLVAVDREFLHLLLNWLIAAQAVDPSLQNVLVASNSKEVCHLMNLMGIDSVHMPIASVVKITNLPFRKVFFLMRLAVIRVLNYLGCDVLNSDADAVTLKNFRPLLEKHGKADVIASRGRYPGNMGWKKTCCMGWILYRSSKSTDQMWQLAAEVDDLKMRDDQVMMNNLLMKKMHVEWQEEWLNDEENIGYGINGFTIVNLAEAEVCRERCERKYAQVSVFHKKFYQKDMDQTIMSLVWKLDEHWNEIVSLWMQDWDSHSCQKTDCLRQLSV